MKINELVEQQKKYYKKIGTVYSPALNEEVKFRSNGFFHLLNKSNNKPRKVSEKWLKLKSLSYAPDVIKMCTSISDVRSYTLTRRGKSKNVTHYELIHVFGNGLSYQVIVEREGNGSLQFKSVMPLKKRKHTS